MLYGNPSSPPSVRVPKKPVKPLRPEAGGGNCDMPGGHTVRFSPLHFWMQTICLNQSIPPWNVSFFPYPHAPPGWKVCASSGSMAFPQADWSQMRHAGIGFRAHSEPAGCVPSVTLTSGISTRGSSTAAALLPGKLEDRALEAVFRHIAVSLAQAP
eukprot:53131-Prymnesium_polylepis.2